MKRFEFDDTLKLGIAAIDQQHERFIELLNEAWEVQEKEGDHDAQLSVLANLTDYALKHFADEEALMQKFEYPDYPAHRELHNQTTGDLFDYNVRLLSSDPEQTRAFLNFLISWLNNHILNTDKKLAAFLKEKGAAG